MADGEPRPRTTLPTPTLLLLLFLACCSALAAATPTNSRQIHAPSQTQDLFVDANDGNDANSGTSPGSAVKTLARALALRAALPQPLVVTVHFAPGVYPVAEEIALTDAMANTILSGSSADQSAVRLSGGLELSGLAWRAGSKAGVWVAPLPASVSASISPANLTQLWLDNTRLHRARTATLAWKQPLPGNASYGLVVDASDIPAHWDLAPAALARWRVHAFHSWVKSVHTVARVTRSADNRTATLVFAEPALFPYGDYLYCSQRRYFIEGPAELAPAPGSGQWRLRSAATLELEYAPSAGAPPPSAASVLALPLLPTLMSGYGVANLTLRNLSISTSSAVCSRRRQPSPCDGDMANDVSAALALEQGDGVVLQNVRLANLGGGGAALADVTRLVVRGCVAHDVAGTAFQVSGPGLELSRTRITGFGQRFPAGVGVALGAGSPAAQVVHNEMTSGYFNGVGASAGSDTAPHANISYNLIHNNGKLSADGICDFGGIHIGSTNSTQPVYLWGNVIRNISAFANGGVGLYADVSSTALDMRYNLVEGTIGPALQWHKQPDIPLAPDAAPMVFDNNVWVLNRQSAYGAAKGIEALRWDGYVYAQFTRNIVLVDAVHAPAHKALFGGLACKDQLPHGGPANCSLSYLDNFLGDRFANNVYFNTTGRVSASFPGPSAFAAWQKNGLDAGSLCDVDPKLDPSSFVWTNPSLAPLGIDKLRISDAGIGVGL